MSQDPALPADDSTHSNDEWSETACDEFEAALKNGRSPRIEEYLNRVAEHQRDPLLNELLRIEVSWRKRWGEKPAPQPYCDRFPGKRDLIDRAFSDVGDPPIADGTNEFVAAEPTQEPERPEISLAFPEGSRWEIQEEVGAGGMGVVYRAFDKKLDIQVAIKLLLPGYSLSRFLREARTMAKIHSDHVVHLYDYELLTGGHPILVMQWIDGLDLLKTIRKQGAPLAEEQVLPWMRQTCEGMLAAAEQGISHRDLKPSNILIDWSGKARVADFGLARDPNATDLSTSSQLMGTPLYMAPEQAEDPSNIDPRSDIYSFGATFYHALTGEPPFTGPILTVLSKHKTEPLMPPRVRNSQLTPRTSEILERCLAKSPAQRFQNFGQVLSELQRSDVASPWETSGDGEMMPYLIWYRRRRDAYLNAREPFRGQHKYGFPGGGQLLIVAGDILHQDVDVIVSSSDQDLSMNYGVSRAIQAAAGDEVLREARRYAPVRPGRAVVTSAGKLKARFIFHGITSGYWNDADVPTSRDIISEILASCFYHAESLSVQSIAFPLLGTGAMGFSRHVCLETMFHFLVRTLLQGVTPVQDVRIMIFPERS